MAQISSFTSVTNQLLDALAQASRLRTGLEKIDRSYDPITQALAKEATGHNNEHWSKLQQSINGLLSSLKGLVLHELFGDVHELRGRIEVAGKQLLTNVGYEEILHRIDAFTKAANSFYPGDRTQDQAIQVLLAAHELRLNIDILEQSVQAIGNTPNGRIDLERGLDVLVLVFDSVPTVENLQNKLSIIQGMYMHAAEAAGGVEPTELTVYRIEAGSLTLQLIGHHIQNLLIVMGIRSALAGSFRHITRSGQLATFREEQGALQALLENTDRIEGQLGTSNNTHAALEQILSHQTERARHLLTNENYLWLNGLPFIRAGRENQGLLGSAEVPRLAPGESKRRQTAMDEDEV